MEEADKSSKLRHGEILVSPEIQSGESLFPMERGMFIIQIKMY